VWENENMKRAKHIHCGKCGIEAKHIFTLPRGKTVVETELYFCGEHLWKRYIGEIPSEAGKTIIKEI
jgi:hypothetical protein